MRSASIHSESHVTSYENRIDSEELINKKGYQVNKNGYNDRKCENFPACYCISSENLLFKTFLLNKIFLHILEHGKKFNFII